MLFALCGIIGLSLAFLEYYIRWDPKIPTEFQNGMIELHNNVIHNTGPYPDQYRILTFYLAEVFIYLGTPFKIAYLCIRFLFTGASIFVFYKYLQGIFSPIVSVLGMYLFVSAIPVTYLFYGLQANDPINMLVYILAIWSFYKGENKYLIPLVIVGMLNRETAILLPLIYALVNFGIKPLKKWLPTFLSASFIAFAIYFGLRYVYGLKAPYAPTSPLHYWWENTTDWKTYVQIIGFFNISLILAWRGWVHKPEFFKRISWILPLFFLIHFTQGYLVEIRYFLPVLPIIIPLTLYYFESREERELRYSLTS
jgi:hypothetical protein